MIRVSGIVEESCVDGPGIRFVVFAQGCRHRCPACHNPQTHPFEGGFLTDSEAILERMKANPLLDGLTLSGGDPFEQAEAFAGLAGRARQDGYNVVTYTGWRYEEILLRKEPGWMRLLESTDILVDGRFELALKSGLLPFRGSSNQRLIDVPRSLREGHCRVYEIPNGHG
ncbi:MAG: anaerobic ribonucleoside-triphosphate reductase activating protein [Synergistaceae bacterium]|jgi:anaerobic ribonucleoside-triphosphate reductase activating protein|nr:anaerobic ribonucleoside-triphosphate reductase activating protein [Synergistaceae bacterium]